MKTDRSFKKFSKRDAAFFSFLFIMCVAGSIAFMWLAVGIDSGNRIIKDFLSSLLNNAVGIVTALVFFNLFLIYYFSKRRS